MTTPTALTRSLFADEALRYVGFPSLRYTTPDKGADESGFDCSGFVRFIVERVRHEIAPHIRHTNTFFNEFGIPIHAEFAGKGDLIFLSRDGLRPTHIGILLTPFNYIHAPGVAESVVEVSPTMPKNVIECREPRAQIYFRNPIGFKRLAVQRGRYRYPLE